MKQSEKQWVLFKMIEVIDQGGCRIVTINRPDKANSLTAEMLERLWEIAEGARDVQVLILTGVGKVFSAGADLEAAKAGLATSPLWERLSGAIAALPGLTIAALNGTLAGGANGMALACDLRIAVPGAKFFYPVMKLGYLPQPSDPVRMAALIGPARTKLILMGGQKILADEALRFGLIDRIVDGDVVAEARAIAEDTLNADPETVRDIKKMCEGKSLGA
jgi:enoyl-CoA hydratase/carnithine racemase